MQQWTDDEVGGYMPPAQDGAEDGTAQEEFYYYYEMPDGSVGYIAASDYTQQQEQEQQQQQLYSPEDQGVEDGGLQPAGYTEPTHGEGTPYAPPLQETVTPPSPPPTHNVVPQQINTNYYYYYDPSTAAPEQPSAAPPAAASLHSQRGKEPASASPWGMEAAPLPQLPHEADAGTEFSAPKTFDELRRWDGTQKWHTSPWRSCWKEPCFCLGACVAPWCIVAAHRRRLLRHDYTRYRCCGGVCGPVDGCECCGSSPRCSLFWEVFLCLPCACHGNRFLLMQRYGLKASCFDRTVTGCGCFCAPLHWCRECTCCFPETMWDWLYVAIYPCMLTQHHRELDAHATDSAAPGDCGAAAAPEH